MKQTIPFKKILLCGGGAVMAVVLVGQIPDQTSGSDVPRGSKVTRPVIRRRNPEPPVAVIIPASKLFEAYKKSESDADLKYSGKRLRVQGIVDAAGKSNRGIPYVRLKTGDLSSPVLCLFEEGEGDNPLLTGLTGGSSIAITGDCVGKMMGRIVLLKSTFF